MWLNSLGSGPARFCPPVEKKENVLANDKSRRCFRQMKGLTDIKRHYYGAFVTIDSHPVAFVRIAEPPRSLLARI